MTSTPLLGAAGGAAGKLHDCPDCRCAERAANACPHPECGHSKWLHEDTKRGGCSVRHGPRGTPCPCPGLHVKVSGEAAP